MVLCPAGEHSKNKPAVILILNVSGDGVAAYSLIRQTGGGGYLTQNPWLEGECLLHYACWLLFVFFSFAVTSTGPEAFMVF